MRAALALALVLATFSSARADEAPRAVKRFALVVGSNASPHAGLATLRYADDDAVRWTLLLRTFGAEVTLLTELDAESARLYGPSVPAHGAPGVSQLDAAMERLAGAMREARAAGARTAFIFVYAGHGDVDAKAGEGYVALGQERFSRSELEAHVLAVSPADTNHVIIDACRSFYLAASRGPGGSRRPWPQPYFDASAAARFPNTGFLLASSSGGASHEWEEFQAGVFSHELRSGLLGGADADGDGRVTYRELAAFVHVANQAVRNERYRPDILAQPPRTGDAVLVSFDQAQAGRVRIGAGRAGRYVLEDGLGIRWADVHPSAAQDVALAMPAAWGDGQSLFLQSPGEQREYRLERGTVASLPALTPRPLSVGRRGAVHEAFALLFSVPFDAASLPVNEDAPGLVLRAPPPARETAAPRLLRPLAIGATAGAVAAGVATGLLAWRTADLRADNGQDVAATNAQIDSGNRWTLAAGVTAGVLAATAIVLYVLDRR